jgi:hypothetical protein
VVNAKKTKINQASEQVVAAWLNAQCGMPPQRCPKCDSPMTDNFVTFFLPEGKSRGRCRCPSVQSVIPFWVNPWQLPEPLRPPFATIAGTLSDMAFQPMPLSRRPAPFDHPEWVFELKYDGFRSLAVIQNGLTELISRNGHPFSSFDKLQQALTAPGDGKTVLDGEIVCVDKRGRTQFNDLLFHRAEPRFFAFDLLMADGKDLRTERLTDRKHELRRLLSRVPTSHLQYVDHVEKRGTALFERVCEMDLEGIVAKHSHGNYVTESQQTTWIKIKNRSYSQSVGREKLFDRERHKEPVPGWHSCDLACAEFAS